MSEFSQTFESAYSPKPPLHGDRSRVSLHGDAIVRGKLQRYADEDSFEEFDDPVGFQRQLFQQQLRAFGGSSSGCSRRAKPIPHATIPRSTVKHVAPASAWGATRVPHVGRQVSGGFMEEADAEDEQEMVGELPAACPPFEEERPPQQIVVVVPYPMQHAPDHPHVRPPTRLSSEKILFAIPPLVLLLVLAVGLARALRKAARKKLRRALSRERRIHRRRFDRRYSRPRRVLDDTYTEVDFSETESSEVLRAARSEHGPHTARKQVHRMEVKQLMNLPRDRAAQKTAAASRVTAQKDEAENQTRRSAATLKRSHVHAAEAHSDTFGKTSGQPLCLQQTHEEKIPEPLERTLLLRKNERGRGTSARPRDRAGTLNSARRKSDHSGRKALESAGASTGAPVYAIAAAGGPSPT